MPVAVDTLGPLVEDAHRFIKQIGNSWMREKIDTGILSCCIGAYPSGDSALQHCHNNNNNNIRHFMAPSV